jgi:hypothetical protein
MLSGGAKASERFVFPASSWILFAWIEMPAWPVKAGVGVNVAVRTSPVPATVPSVPPVTVSLAAASEIFSLSVNVIVAVSPAFSYRLSEEIRTLGGR